MTLPKQEQLIAILNPGLLDEDWYRRNLPDWSPEKLRNAHHHYKFSDLFDVTLEEALVHVERQGWNPKIVAFMNEPLPSSHDSTASAADYVLLPMRDGVFPLAIQSMTWPERPRWAMLEFASDRARLLHILESLFSRERNFWG